MYRFSRVAVLAGTLISLQGCLSMGLGKDEYTCSGMPTGQSCLSARAAYEQSHSMDDDYVDLEGDVAANHGGPSFGKTSTSTQNNTSGMNESAELRYVNGSGSGYEKATGPDVGMVKPDPLKVPRPIRTQAQVMRIWIAPWESSSGDLNVPGYIYSDVEPRTWEIGFTQTASKSRVLRPASR